MVLAQDRNAWRQKVNLDNINITTFRQQEAANKAYVIFVYKFVT